MSSSGSGSWLDRFVQRAGRRMAGGSSRRKFLGKVGAGVAAVGTASLFASKAEATCSLPAGCFGTVDVNVCYSPWQVVAAEAGQSGVVVRKGPSFSADPVTNASLNPVVIPVGGTFARCSNRDGGSGCPDPGPRVNQNGFLWGYWIGYPRQGWMPYSVGGVTYASSETNYANTLCGPAGYDFDCRLGSSHPKSDCSKNVCGGTDGGTATCSTTYRPVVANPSDPSDERFYLRYAANSTTFFWLVPGDQVVRYAYKSGSGYTWSCVQVICAKYAPNGCRGWVRSDALGAPNSLNTPCYPSVTCPSGS